MSEKLEIPESILKQLLEAAKSTGTTPAGWIQAHLPKKQDGKLLDASEEELLAADLRLDQCIVHLGRQTGIENEGN